MYAPIVHPLRCRGEHGHDTSADRNGSHVEHELGTYYQTVRIMQVNSNLKYNGWADIVDDELRLELLMCCESCTSYGIRTDLVGRHGTRLKCVKPIESTLRGHSIWSVICNYLGSDAEVLAVQHIHVKQNMQAQNLHKDTTIGGNTMLNIGVSRNAMGTEFVSQSHTNVEIQQHLDRMLFTGTKSRPQLVSKGAFQIESSKERLVIFDGFVMHRGRETVSPNNIADRFFIMIVNRRASKGQRQEIMNANF